MKLYVDADLKVVKKSNDEALQLSRLRSSTHLRSIDVSPTPVKRSSGSRRFESVFRQYDDVQMVENTPILRTFQTSGTHVSERREEGERTQGDEQGEPLGAL
jgi:hypothetical protein